MGYTEAFCLICMTPRGGATCDAYEKAILVQSTVELSTSLELGNLLGCDLNLLLCSRVDTFAGRTLVNAECTETDQSNLVAFY